jgi:hypothetical protein
MIETLDLLTEDKILEQRRATLASTETVLILNGTSHIRGQVDVLILEVERRQELLGVGSSVTITSAV